MKKMKRGIGWRYKFLLLTILAALSEAQGVLAQGSDRFVAGDVFGLTSMFNPLGFDGWPGVYFKLLFWALVILTIAFLIRAAMTSVEYKQDNSLNILKERYARGEIGKYEFEELLEDLGRMEQMEEVKEIRKKEAAKGAS